MNQSGRAAESSSLAAKTDSETAELTGEKFLENVARAADEAHRSAVETVLSASETGSTNEISAKSIVIDYGIATAMIVVASVLNVAFSGFFRIETTYLLFSIAILIAAWRGGLFVGLYTTIASAAIVGLFLNQFNPNLSLVILIAHGALISVLCASRLRNERLLQNSGRELENRVAHRTMQLAQANIDLQKEIDERAALQEDLRRARDAALETARLKSEFLANMSHEIRTPMNGVIGMTGLLLDTNLDEEQKRFAQTIRGSGESLLTIINDILDFSKVEAGKLELETLDFNLRETIESLIDMFSNRAREQRNELAALIYSDVPLFLRGDAGRIRQILTNLLGNAIKFTRYGDIMIRVEKIQENTERVRIKISVSDTGEGVSEEIQARLFQPFTQSDASTTRRYGGTGLGLSISKKLVELMNGEIGVESKFGKGSTFWFSLELEKQTEILALTSGRASSPLYPELIGKRVLVVDDNDVNREVLMYQLRSWMMESEEAGDGINAVNLVENSSKPFDLIILDLQMPIVDGLQTAEKLRALKLDAPPPIVMISSSSFKVGEQKKRELGIQAFLNKPYRQSDLLRGVCEALEIQQIPDVTELADSDIHIHATEERTQTAPAGEKLKRVLIVEDNSVNQLVAQNLLRRFGYHSDVAANGKEALRALEIIPYDLVLMDCQMPEMDGYEATRAIRARHWPAARIPIIALTAHVTSGEREKCLEAGMDDYISKPIEKDVLRQMMAYWLMDLSGDHSSQPTPTQKNANQKMFDGAPEPFNAPAIDIDVLDDITDHNADMRREVVEIYLAQMVVYLFELEQAIAAGDADMLCGAAHKAVGGSALCGMNAIVAPLRKLEELGRAKQMSEALPYFIQTQKAFAAIGRECRERLLISEETLCERL